MIKIKNSGQSLKSIEINKSTQEMLDIISRSIDKENALKQLSEHLTQKYGQKITVSNYKITRGINKDLLEIILDEDSEYSVYKNLGNKLIKGDIDEYNKNGVFFFEKKLIIEGSGSEFGKSHHFKYNLIEGKIYSDTNEYLKNNNFVEENKYYEYLKQIQLANENIKIYNAGPLMREAEKNLQKIIENNKKHDIIINFVKDLEKKHNSYLYNPEIERIATDNFRKRGSYGMSYEQFRSQVEATPIKIKGSLKIPEIEIEIKSVSKKNGKWILTVNDFRNNFNTKRVKHVMDYYKERDIELKNSFMGSWTSTNFAFSEMKIKGEEAYEKEYSDGLKILRIQAVLDLMEKAVVKHSESQGVDFSHPLGETYDNMKEALEKINENKD